MTELPPPYQPWLLGTGGSRQTVSTANVQQSPVRLSTEQIAKLTPAQKLDYAKQWDQSKMPPWRDPRGG